MRLDVVFLPRDLTPGQLAGRTVAVFDVLRATTTMCAALAAGVREIRLFAATDAARDAAATFTASAPLLVGEVNCLPPPGFDLGNSPGPFDPATHADQTLFMCTTNGTRAFLAAAEGELVLAAALVNASTVAEHLLAADRDVTLLCAGTRGDPSMEDLIGAGAVIQQLSQSIHLDFDSDRAAIAEAAFAVARDQLPAALRRTQGGQHVIAAGLEADIEFAANLNAIPVVGRLDAAAPVLRRC